MSDTQALYYDEMKTVLSNFNVGSIFSRCYLFFNYIVECAQMNGLLGSMSGPTDVTFFFFNDSVQTVTVASTAAR